MQVGSFKCSNTSGAGSRAGDLVSVAVAVAVAVADIGSNMVRAGGDPDGR